MGDTFLRFIFNPEMNQNLNGGNNSAIVRKRLVGKIALPLTILKVWIKCPWENAIFLKYTGLQPENGCKSNHLQNPTFYSRVGRLQFHC